jgi:hypothetical protein
VVLGENYIGSRSPNPNPELWELLRPIGRSPRNRVEASNISLQAAAKTPIHNRSSSLHQPSSAWLGNETLINRVPYFIRVHSTNQAMGDHQPTAPKLCRSGAWTFPLTFIFQFCAYRQIAARLCQTQWRSVQVHRLKPSLPHGMDSTKRVVGLLQGSNVRPLKIRSPYQPHIKPHNMQ